MDERKGTKKSRDTFLPMAGEARGSGKETRKGRMRQKAQIKGRKSEKEKERSLIEGTSNRLATDWWEGGGGAEERAAEAEHRLVVEGRSGYRWHKTTGSFALASVMAYVTASLISQVDRAPFYRHPFAPFLRALLIAITSAAATIQTRTY